MNRKNRVLKLALAFACGVGMLSQSVAAQDVARGEQSGRIQWGIWIDPDGCMHWMADGGIEQVQVNRLDPKTGKPVCVREKTCFVGESDTLFATNSAKLTSRARKELRKVFKQDGVFGYAVYGHTDSRASQEHNQILSEHRARAVANVGRSVGAVIEREIGFGETQPRASNKSAAGQRKNRRVEVVCYRW